MISRDGRRGAGGRDVTFTVWLARALVRRGMRVLILDPPGFGYSDKPRRALSQASGRGELVAVDPGRYPAHFRALTGFHRELSRLPRVPAVPPLGWDAAREYLAAHAASRNVTLS